ncbi:MAG: family 43 glycosylhydrolase [Lachnospiraceae bacterium]
MTRGWNPILPADVYIPDGEPHVFGDRLYLFGSHDREGGSRYCEEGNYMGWSAPLSDPQHWTCSGEIYSPKQDPTYTPGDDTELYAPDVMQGNDGRYYLYYCFGGSQGNSRIGVAVCDTPDGRYAYYGQVQNPDGSVCHDYLMGDPGVLNDEGTPRLYCGWSLSLVAAAAHSHGRGTTNAGQSLPKAPSSASFAGALEPGDPKMNEKLAPVYRMLFHREPEEVRDLAYPLMGANAYELEEDMITVKGGGRRIVPGQFDTPRDSSFYGHAFYEASSIRKIRGRYYFIYSSENSNELCYAISSKPDRDFVYGGAIISNGDVGLNGRTAADRTNLTANNHGSLVCVNGQWYIFYHRHTHRGTFSRQACAEPVTIREDGSIEQAECTSMGLGGVISAEGTLPAAACCVLTNGHMPHITNTVLDDDIPFVTHEGKEHFVTGIRSGVTVGYKYLSFGGQTILEPTFRGDARGKLFVYAVPRGEVITAERQVPEKAAAYAAVDIAKSADWTRAQTALDLCGEYALYLCFEGEGRLELLDLAFSKNC